MAPQGLRLLIDRQEKRLATVPAKVKRAVRERDGQRCQWPTHDGGICGSTVRLEFDRVVPRGRGGPSTVENCRVLCDVHNREAARRAYGDDLVDLFAPRAGDRRAVRPRGIIRLPAAMSGPPTAQPTAKPTVPPAAPTTVAARAPSRWLLLSLLLGVAVVDQVTKWIALSLLPYGRRMSFLGDTVRLEHARNLGGFLGAGAGLDAGLRGAIFLWGVALVTLAAALGALSGKFPRWQAVGMALVAGGGIGNLIDRIRTGSYVVDFMNVGLGWLRTGIFNVADMAIMAGVGLLLLPVRPKLERGPSPR
jgi:signal peptidase II